jgi:acyl-CoA synthetase (AMP-forming)/AMP-acid ligase II
MVTWLPLFHDMGLIGNVLQPLYVGFPSVLLSPVSFLQKPVRWLKAISEYGATTTGAPNFAYDLCVKTITEPEKETLDLSSVRVLYNGSEPVRAETIDRFVASFQQCGLQGRAFFPCYGLAEATLFVTGGPYDKEPSRLCVDADALTDGKVVPATGKLTRDRWLVSSGRPAEGTVIAAVDPVSRSPLPDGIVGELWVSSAAVSSGYYGRALESRQVFGNYFSNGEGPFLNTGDLGFLRSGEVYVTGRSKDLIIISGRNIYPQDVELVVESVILSIGPNSCAAFALEVGGKERLAIIVEADRQMVRDSRGLNEGEYCQSLSSPAVARLWEVVDSVCTAVLSEVEIAVQSMTFVRPGTFLRTSSGKVQRRAALAALQENAVEVVFTWDAEAPGVLSRTPRISSSHQASRTN